MKIEIFDNIPIAPDIMQFAMYKKTRYLMPKYFSIKNEEIASPGTFIKQ